MNGFIAFLVYLLVAVILMGTYMFVYEKVTPYREFAEIKDGNMAAAIAFSGAILGFILPLASSIFFTRDLLEMVKWALITGVVQMLVFKGCAVFFGCDDCVKTRNVPGAVLLATLSFSVGVLNAISISH